jgi:hypothetical protein
LAQQGETILIYVDTSVILAELLAEDRKPPIAVRTLAALHLASIEFLRGRRNAVRLATLDERMAAAARRLKIPLVDV